MGQQVRVLADPAKAGAGGEGALRQRSIIDIGGVAGRYLLGAQVGGKGLQASPERDVIVGAECVASDPPGRFSRRAVAFAYLSI